MGSVARGFGLPGPLPAKSSPLCGVWGTPLDVRWSSQSFAQLMSTKSTRAKACRMGLGLALPHIARRPTCNIAPGGGGLALTARSLQSLNSLPILHRCMPCQQTSNTPQTCRRASQRVSTWMILPREVFSLTSHPVPAHSDEVPRGRSWGSSAASHAPTATKRTSVAPRAARTASAT